jgi:hypothetical protein
MANVWQVPQLQRFGTFAELTLQTPQECIADLIAGNKTIGGNDGCEVQVGPISVTVGSP